MILTADIPGERLDAFLARSLPDMTRSAAQRLIEENCVTRNGKPGKKNDKLNPGDEIAVTMPQVMKQSATLKMGNSIKSVWIISTT